MSKKEIDKYMFVSEAAERWGESIDAIKIRCVNATMVRGTKIN